MARRRDDYYDRDDRRSSSRRSSGSRSAGSNRSRSGSYSRRRKTEREARVERVTWGLLVLVFAVLYLLPDANIPNWTIPFAGAVILIGSGMYQYGQRFRVSPITWMAGAVMALFAYYSFSTGANMTPFTLLAFAAIIILGVVTGET
ncbi:MAG: hypothetical protein SF162_05445 [bacterium]|nr:hypothetical protein [bacterium]